MAWNTKQVVGQLVEALHQQHVPECYTECFGEERKTGLGYHAFGEDVVMADNVNEYPVVEEEEVQRVDEGGVGGLGESAQTDADPAMVQDDLVEGDVGEVKLNLTEWESAKTLAAQAEKIARAADRTAYFAQMQALYKANGPFKNRKVNPRHELRVCRWYSSDTLW
ncbi:hypothetical protein LTR49_018901 [Elasticomyces elasticus]|nr:hypothetical protein LTR49_018901 [Elasticomyces elasticus]KAK5761844.1 hypothetical protein LTS12_008099 [Elasticomyces elasticus]